MIRELERVDWYYLPYTLTIGELERVDWYYLPYKYCIYVLSEANSQDTISARVCRRTVSGDIIIIIIII
jgi:hypothetical protein